MPMASPQAIWRSLRSARCGPPAEGTVLDTFQALVRPVVRPQLTPFCRQLTNIQQADVDGAELFPAVAARLASFAQRHQAPGATWGSWAQFDAKQLARDCERHGIQNPLAAFEHVNLKRRFAEGPQDQGSGDGPRACRWSACRSMARTIAASTMHATSPSSCRGRYK